MTMTSKHIRQLDTETIRYECSNSSFQRGKQYFDNKRVTDFHIDHAQASNVAITSRVKGSHATPYKQLISIKWQEDKDSPRIIGQCSCPIGYNCKHVAAACLEYIHRIELQTPKLASTACFDWLEKLEEESFPDIDDHAEFLAYVLKTNGTKPDLIVDLVITKAKKSGGLTKGRAVNAGNLNYNFSYGYKLPAYLRPADEEIIKLLNSLSFPNYQPHIKGSVGAIVLLKMLNSGRLFWQNLENPALNCSEPREIACQWQADANGNYRLIIECVPAARLIFTEPAFYIDSAVGCIGQILTPQFDNIALRKLVDAPSIPAEYAEQFTQRLLFDYPHLKIPAPRQIEIIDINDLAPKPHLTLQGKASSGDHYFHQLKLEFDYGKHTLAACEQEETSIVQTREGYLRIHRDLEFETNCIKRLLDAGFRIIEELHVTDLLFYSAANSTIESAGRWYDFLQFDIPELEQQGWIVGTDTSFRLNFSTATDWEAEIEENQNDWFEMRFMVNINGQALPLLPLLMPVLENYELANLPDLLTVPLGNHEYLTLPSAKLKPFLNILFEMFGSHHINAEGNLKLSRFDAAGLAELESHSYGLFSLKGGAALRELGRKIQNFSGIANVALPENLHAELRNYQHQGLNWLQFLREYQFGGILADDMGLGKTLQTLTHLLLEKQQGRLIQPCLIIAPTSLMSNWRREAARFTPDLKVLILQGTERKLLFDKISEYDLVLTTYPLLPRDEEFLLAQSYYYLILDEAQIVKNPNAKAAKIVRAINAEHRLCLTGTPMENHLGELWTQFDFLMPGFLGDSSSFKRQYRTPIELHGDGEQRQRLAKRITPFMLRRTKQQVVTELPAKSEIISAVPLGEKQAMLYESIRLTMELKVQQAIAERGLARSHIAILDALLKLRQTCCDPRTLPLTEAKKIHESAKLDLLMEMLPELLEEGRRILIFSQFTKMLALIETELNKNKILFSKLTGQTRNREEAIDSFKSGTVNVFLISLKAGGVGLNLTEADTVIIYDPWWNPAVENQAADRAHRIGQEKPVFVYKLITENTVEEKILAMQDRKRALAEGVYQGDKKSTALNFSSEDLSALFQPL